jgi:hypothetical protein
MVPAVLALAGLFVLTVGVAAAQAAVRSGRTAGFRLPAVVHGATNVWLVATGVVILAVVVGAVVAIVLADRRQLTPAMVAAEPTQLSGATVEAEQERKAA